MSGTFPPAETLRQNRPLLLAMEAIGWFHMAGKAKAEFLRQHGDENNSYDYKEWHQQETPPFPWDSLLNWVQGSYRSRIPDEAWPGSFAVFTEKHAGRDPGLLGLLQAGHGVVSGIEKNLPRATSGYLRQTNLHTWLSSPWGHPKRNLLADPPEILSPEGWRRLVEEIRRVLEELKDLGIRKNQDLSFWRSWRERAIGEGSFVRRAFLSTLAETRLPNNDVTLWDQSYVAAALFKSAVAGALLNSGFLWDDKGVKQKTRWRLLTVALGTEHYEARAVKIGDWTGAQGAIDAFFQRVAELIEVDLAVGSLLYRDSSVAVFSFPGESNEATPASWLNDWEQWLLERVDTIAQDLDLETPPYIHLSDPTRSLVPMVREIREARNRIAIPVHRPWDIRRLNPSDARGHVCPVCQVRFNGDPTDKSKPCKVCGERRHHRRNAWLDGQLGDDTIWFEEVADQNDRLALLTFSLDLEDWLNGERVDSLRAQAIPEWVRFNPVLEEYWQRDESRRQKLANPVAVSDSVSKLFCRVVKEIKQGFRDSDGNWKFPPQKRDVFLFLVNLQEGFRHVRDLNPQVKNDEHLWRIFYEEIVEDRADAPAWDALNDDQRAAWLTHQLFRKLPSPGRVYRFWREAEEFFQDLLREFRQLAARSPNSWRVRRLVVKLKGNPPGQGGSTDPVLYNGRWRGKPISLLRLPGSEGFLTVSNLARLLQPEDKKDALKDQQMELWVEDSQERHSVEVAEVSEPKDRLGVYCPVIPLELSPLRFRLLVPLEAASACVDLAVNQWRERFARVWDRLPLRVGVVAFPRPVAFQGVLEGVRNLEDALQRSEEEEWTVEEARPGPGAVSLLLKRKESRSLRVVSTFLPDGREDVFYPYAAVNDQIRYPRDFRHPGGQVYRHVADLRFGDRIRVAPARLATLFMGSTAERFDLPTSRYLEDWTRMREVWALLQRVAPSQTALQHLRSELARAEAAWSAPDGDPAARQEAWRAYLEALIATHLEVKGNTLAALIEAALDGTLQWALDWHMTALKESV
ncbi:CRISPR-associated protein Csx11 [Thermus sp.]|uniref:CRISPR-associated protein Csx11 n=1 Tax=Thermus sp. TaxID=275 RepID=UPI003D121018